LSTQEKLELKKLWVLMVTAVIDMIGFALIVPLLPFYATEFGADAFTVGLLMASFAVGTMVTAPLWGRISDRFGRKPVLMAAQLMSAVAFLFFAFADDIWLLFLCRFLQGVGGGSIGAVSAWVGDSVRPEERAQALGWITAATSAGVMLGPAIGSLTVGISRHAPGLIAAALCGVNLLFTWRWLTESRSEATREAAKTKKPVGGQVLAVVTHPARPIHSLIWIYTAGMMAFMAQGSVMALYLAHRFAVTEKTVGYFYVAIGLVSLVMRGLILGPMVRAYGEVRVLRLGAVSLGLGMVGVTLAPNLPIFIAFMALVPTGTALLFPCTTSLITRFAPPDAVGQTVGVQQSFGGLSRLLAPIWAGASFQAIGPRWPFWIGGALVLATAAFALRLKPGEAPLPRGAEGVAES
jgi:multidrug resistance protein